MNNVIVILSGGMDSTTLLYEVINDGYLPVAISFNYGQRHKKELVCARRTCEQLGLEHKVFDLVVLNEVAPSVLTRSDRTMPEGHYAAENMKQTIVPNRNMVMLSLAAAYAMGKEIKDVFYGAHAGDHTIYPDCRPEFVEAMNNVLRKADWNPVELHAPYLSMDKGDIAIRGRALGVNYALTWSCYKGGEKACGKCGSCQERLEAFTRADMHDPIEYEC